MRLRRIYAKFCEKGDGLVGFQIGWAAVAVSVIFKIISTDFDKIHKEIC